MLAQAVCLSECKQSQVRGCLEDRPGDFGGLCGRPGPLDHRHRGMRR